MNKGTIVIAGVAVAMVALIGYVAMNSESSSVPGKLDTFAQCLGEKGVTFYGAFWCPHCQEQKRDFGSSAKFLPYVECSLPDGRTRTPICIEKGIESYPTWDFADGTRVTGNMNLEELRDKTGCELPVE